MSEQAFLTALSELKRSEPLDELFLSMDIPFDNIYHYDESKLARIRKRATFYKKAIKIHPLYCTSIDFNLARMYYNLAICHYQCKKFHKAHDALMYALSITEELEDEGCINMFNIELAIALNYYQAEGFQEAIPYLREVIENELCFSSLSKEIQCQIYMNYIFCNSIEENLEEVMEYTLKLLDIGLKSQELSPRFLRLIILHIEDLWEFEEIYSQIGNFQICKEKLNELRTISTNKLV